MRGSGIAGTSIYLPAHPPKPPARPPSSPTLLANNPAHPPITLAVFRVTYSADSRDLRRQTRGETPAQQPAPDPWRLVCETVGERGS